MTMSVKIKKMHNDDWEAHIVAKDSDSEHTQAVLKNKDDEYETYCTSTRSIAIVEKPKTP